MKPLVEQEKAEYQGKVPFVFYDLGKSANSSIADKYGVTYIPDLIFIGKDGSIVNKIVGATDKATIDQNIKKITE